jgi:hypothetical protein
LYKLGKYYVTLLFMSADETSKHLKKQEADLLAAEFMESLRQISLSETPITLEDVAKSTRSGLRYFEGSVPIPTENTPRFLQSLLSPLMVLQKDKASKDAFLKKYARLFSNFPKTAKGMKSSLARVWLNASPTDVTAIREFIQQLKSLGANPIKMRNQLESTLRKNLKGRPGPKSRIPRQEWARIRESSDKLRPVCQKVLEFSRNESKEPLANVIGAVARLRPEWETQCKFLSSRMDLIIRTLKLSKVRKAKARGQSSKLADALACEFLGYPAAPSYSMQIAEQARRSQK